MDLSHFNVWKEKSFGDFGNLNFLTGAGGYIQNMLMGYGGLRFRDDGLFARLVLPPLGVTEMKLRRVAYQGARITFTVDDDQITVELESAADDVQSFTVKQIGHENRPLELLKPARFPAASELLVAVVTG
jgi:protein-glucosylgalactosylhydroxylysine glucosidase